MIYRDATERDLPEMRAMQHAVNDYPEVSRTPFFWPNEKPLVDVFPLDCFTVAEDGYGKITGMIGSVGVNAVYWHLLDFVVDEASRGNGVGRGLMNAAAAKHRALGRSRSFAVPPPEKQALYVEHFGYKPIAVALEWEHS